MQLIKVYNPADLGILDGTFDLDAAEKWLGKSVTVRPGNPNRNSGQNLLRTAGGRWVAQGWTDYDDDDFYMFISDVEARDWLLCRDYNDAVEMYFGEIPKESGPGNGRPAIGGVVHIRLGDILPRVDKLAEDDEVNRAEFIRRAVTDYVKRRERDKFIRRAVDWYVKNQESDERTQTQEGKASK